MFVNWCYFIFNILICKHDTIHAHTFAHIYICIFIYTKDIRTIESSFGNSWSHFTTRDEMNNAHTHQHKKRFHAAPLTRAFVCNVHDAAAAPPPLPLQREVTTIITLDPHSRTLRVLSGSGVVVGIILMLLRLGGECVCFLSLCLSFTAPPPLDNGRGGYLEKCMCAYFHARAAHILL